MSEISQFETSSQDSPELTNRSIGKQWILTTELIKQQINESNAQQFARLVKKIPDETLPLKLFQMIEAEELASPRLREFLSRHPQLKRYLEIPSTPEERYTFYQGLQRGNPNISESERQRIVQRAAFAREIKLLALYADLLSLGNETLSKDHEFTTPNGANMIFNPQFENLRPFLLDPTTWESKRVIKDRVHSVIIGGKRFILKEGKTIRHQDVAGGPNRNIRFGNTPKQEYEVALALAKDGVAQKGDVCASWETPIAWVGFPDQENFQLVLFKEVPQAFDSIDYSSRDQTRINYSHLLASLTKAIMTNIQIYKNQFEDLRLKASQLYPQVSFWDTEKFPSYIDQFEADQESPQTLSPEDFTDEDIAAVLAGRLITEATHLLQAEIISRGFYNNDHNGMGEYIFRIGISENERVVLHAVGIDLEYVQPFDSEIKLSRLDGYKQINDYLREKIDKSGITQQEFGFLRLLSIIPSKKYAALGKTLGIN